MDLPSACTPVECMEELELEELNKYVHVVDCDVDLSDNDNNLRLVLL